MPDLHPGSVMCFGQLPVPGSEVRHSRADQSLHETALLGPSNGVSVTRKRGVAKNLNPPLSRKDEKVASVCLVALHPLLTEGFLSLNLTLACWQYR